MVNGKYTSCKPECRDFFSVSAADDYYVRASGNHMQTAQ